MSKTVTLATVIALLKKKQGKRSLREFARALGISAPYLSDIYLGRRRPGPAVLQHLGLHKELKPQEPTYTA
jgi:transcriptional regulator with XRE-family HTH domain